MQPGPPQVPSGCTASLHPEAGVAGRHSPQRVAGLSTPRGKPRAGTPSMGQVCTPPGVVASLHPEWEPHWAHGSPVWEALWLEHSLFVLGFHLSTLFVTLSQKVTSLADLGPSLLLPTKGLRPWDSSHHFSRWPLLPSFTSPREHLRLMHRTSQPRRGQLQVPRGLPTRVRIHKLGKV